MKITALKEQVKDQNRVSIFVDGTYSLSLTLDQVLEQKIKVGQELDTASLAALKKLSDEGKLYGRALEWLMRRPHSVREFKDYMYRKKSDPEQTEMFIQKLTKNNYLNDEKFAQWWLAGRLSKNKSLRSVITELKAKGVDPVIIQNVVDENSQTQADQDGISSDNAALQVLINKLKDRPSYADQNRLIRYLLGKGFNYGDIKEALKEED